MNGSPISRSVIVCQRRCAETLSRCGDDGGGEVLGRLRDCLDLTHLLIAFALRGSPLTSDLQDLCGRSCRRCAELLAEGDRSAAACAEACRAVAREFGATTATGPRPTLEPLREGHPGGADDPGVDQLGETA